MARVVMSEASQALAVFAKGKDAPLDLVREGAVETIAENRRLREILRVMQASALGEAAMVEVLRPTKESALRFVVCCGSRDERTLAEGIHEVMRRIFARVGVELTQTEGTITGTDAMDDTERDAAGLRATEPRFG
jgi:hypothetical protein